MGERCGDFLGEFYDYDAGTRKLTTRTVEKARMIQTWLGARKEGKTSVTARQISVIMGLLFWTASVLALPLCKYFHLLRDYRKAGALASVAQEYDTVAIELTPTATSELNEWLRVAIANKETAMHPELFGKPSLSLIVDASGIGYCAIATTDFTDCQILSGSWSGDQKHLAQSSVWAEPECIYLACLRYVRQEDRFVRVFTDHSPIVYANRAGYAKGFNPNHLLERLKRTFPNTLFEIVHVKGELNPADRYSRLGDMMGEKELNGEELKMVAMLAAEEWGQCLKDNVSSASAYNKRPTFMV